MMGKGAHTSRVGIWYQREHGHSIGPAMISAGILRFRYWPAPSRPRNRPFSTTTLPRSIVTTGQAKMSWPSHGV